MIISDISVRRPVFAAVISLLLMAFGAVAFDLLPLSEYPETDPPVVTIDTEYRGAAAAVVETRITQPIEERIAGIAGIESVSSTSGDGRSTVEIQFSLARDIDDAANDVRDRVSTVLKDLPREADSPVVAKQDASDRVILWLSLVSERMDRLALTDYGNRFVADRLATIDGVARVRVSGGLDYAMRIWLDRRALAARNLTVADIEAVLQRENVELPAGTIRSVERDFVVRLERGYRTAEDFRSLVVGKGSDGYLVRLGDVATVELGAAENRRQFRANGVPMVGIGIIKQSNSNTLAVARAVKAERDRINASLPEGMHLLQSFDSSVYIESAIEEVYITLGIAAALVMLVMLVFLGDLRAMLIPAATVPVSLVATCIVLYFFGYSINLLTLLALVLAIGLVVDDSIVVLENIHRRIRAGESPLVAAFLGSRQVGFAVVATTLVLMSVFVPVAFMPGDTGRMFAEFSVTLSIAVAFSGFVALTLSPMMASKILRGREGDGIIARLLDRLFGFVQRGYRRVLELALHFPASSFPIVAGLTALCGWLLVSIPDEFMPREDRGSFFVTATSPPGTTFANTLDTLDKLTENVMYLVEEKQEATRVNSRAPRNFGATADFNESIAVITLEPFGKRRDGFTIMDEVRKRTAGMTEAKVSVIMRQAILRGLNKPMEIVVSGPTFEELAEWRDLILAKGRANPGLIGLDCDYRDTKPQLRVSIDQARAADLGVSSADIGLTLETMLGGRRATTFIHQGEEYDVVLEGGYADKRSPTDLNNLFVRSERTKQLIPLSNLVKMEEFADSGTLNRYNRMRSITFDAELAPGYSLGEGVSYMEELIRENLPGSAIVGYKGNALKLKQNQGSIGMVFALALLIAFLVLAAQFESFVHPFTIMLTVPMAIAGALLGLKLAGMNQSIHSQIGLIMLIGLAAKNGILIVEFINQLRDEGMPFRQAILTASEQRLRPIIMTALATVMGALPLMLGGGAGFETRRVVGVVIVYGVSLATIVTLLLVPMMYALLGRRTGSPQDVSRRLEKALESS